VRDLTNRQEAVLRYVGRALESGLAPTLREIGNALFIRSTNGVNDHLRALERKGYLERQSMKSRAIRLTPQARTFLGYESSTRVELLERVYLAATAFMFEPTNYEHTSIAAAEKELRTALEAVRACDEHETPRPST